MKRYSKVFLLFFVTGGIGALCTVGCGDDDATATCGNGKLGLTEECDCGQDASNLPMGCTAPNGAPGANCTEDCLRIVAESCRNGLDDDLDGLVDCDDPDCDDAPQCAAEICNDRIDNNGNGLLDCEDPDCADAVECESEICDNGVDDNNDGHIDCQDVECYGVPECEGVEVCDNGLDDNNDGYVDCDDEQCADLPVCVTEICDNGVDDDDDGRVDCVDRSCLAREPCQDTGCCSATGCTDPPDDTVSLSATPLEDAVAHVSVDVAQAATHPTGGCAILNGEQYVITVNALTSGRLQVAYTQQGDHKFGLYFTGGPDTACTEALDPQNCEQPGLNTSGVLDFGVLPAAKYILVVAEGSPGNGGTADLVITLSNPTQPAELCDNRLDDDGNLQVDCGDVACYERANVCDNGGCGDATDLADESLGHLTPGTNGVVVSVEGLDTRLQSNDEVLRCGGTGAGDRVYYFHLDAPAFLQLGWLQDMDQHGDHIFSLQFPDGSCGRAEHYCLDTQGWSTGLQNFPGDPALNNQYPAGDYYLVVESRAGAAGRVDFQLMAFTTFGEVCDDAGFDNDGDGLVNCDDTQDCSTHPVCIREDCTDAAQVDEDHDGKVNCADDDPDDQCDCAYGCRTRAEVCDGVYDPEIVDLGLLTFGVAKPFSVTTTGKSADYPLSSCVNDSTEPDMVIRFSTSQTADITMSFTDTGVHVVDSFFNVDRCEPCDSPAKFNYCAWSTSPLYWHNIPPGDQVFIIKPKLAGGSGTFSGSLLVH